MIRAVLDANVLVSAAINPTGHRHVSWRCGGQHALTWWCLMP